jgi:hypothetical protein
LIPGVIHGLSSFFLGTFSGTFNGRKIPPLQTDGTLHSEQPEKADILNGPFQKLLQKKNSISNEEFQKQCKMTGKFDTIKDIHITENGGHKLLKNLNPNKAAGPDNTSTLS